MAFDSTLNLLPAKNAEKRFGKKAGEPGRTTHLKTATRRPGIIKIIIRMVIPSLVALSILASISIA